MVEPDRNIHLNLLELNYLYRYNLFINLVIPAQAGTQTHPHGKLSDKTGFFNSTFWMPACAGMTVDK